METCVICGKEIEGEVIPNITADGEYAPMCLDCTEKVFGD